MTQITEAYTTAEGHVTKLVNIKGLFTTREEAEASLRPKAFEIGENYRWSPKGEAHWHNSYTKYGPLRCVYIGVNQGLFAHDTPQDVGAFENRDGLFIIALRHLLSGDFIKI